MHYKAIWVVVAWTWCSFEIRRNLGPHDVLGSFTSAVCVDLVVTWTRGGRDKVLLSRSFFSADSKTVSSKKLTSTKLSELALDVWLGQAGIGQGREGS